MDTGLLLDLDAAEISALLGTASHLGLRLRGLDPIDYVGFYTKESTLGPPPTLVIRYSLPALSGDYNEDGTVDAADYTVWRDRLGSPNSLPNDDTAGVGADDYDRWKSHFGDSQGAGAGNLQSVPEPAAWALALLGIAWSLRVRTELTCATRSAGSRQYEFDRPLRSMRCDCSVHSTRVNSALAVDVQAFDQDAIGAAIGATEKQTPLRPPAISPVGW